MEARCSNETSKSLIQFTDKGKQAKKISHIYGGSGV